MAVILISQQNTMLVSPNSAALQAPLREAAGTGTTTTTPGTVPNTIAGLSGWWDASTYANAVDANGTPLAGWGLPLTSLTDLSGLRRPVTPFSYGTDANVPVPTPRLSGNLGGVGSPLAIGSGSGMYYPFLDANIGFQVPNVPMGATAAWTRMFVWSRPNWKQAFYPPYTDTSNHALLYSGSTPILQLDGATGAGDLTLFPGSGSSKVLTSAMTRRHTHCVIIRNTPGVGVDAWVDGAQEVAANANPISGTGLGTLQLLHSGASTDGGAQCWFHELAMWERALMPTEIAGLATYTTRWTLGPRKAVALMFNGQSNAVNAVLAANADLILAQGVAWYLGAIAWTRVSQNQNGGPGTIVPGMGIYYEPDEANPPYPGTFLQDPLDGSSPSGWSAGAMGQNTATYISGLAAQDQSDINALVLWWNETDSYRSYAADFTQFQAAATRWVNLFRAMVPGATAGSLPVIWWNAIPYGDTDGIQMHREVVAALVGTSGMNVVMGNPMTADSNNLNASYDPTTGIQTGGDQSHRDLPDLVTFAIRAAPVVARALYASGRNDSLSSIPVGLPAVGGPRVVHAYRSSSTTVVLTIQHDAGTDLIIPLLAQQGQGFLVMDGGSVPSPGTLVPATACTYVDSTHLQLTLAQALVNPPADCLLFYPYGSYTPLSGAPSYTGNMGRGNAVTDNFSTLTPPAGWNIAGDLGSSWGINYPLAATTTPIALSATPT